MAKKMSTGKKVTKKRVKKNVERGQAHIQSSFNNTIVTLSLIHIQEGPIDISNVMLVVDGKATRVGFEVKDGKKVRVAKATGKVID